MPRHFLTVPHIPQRRESDCLAACAAMLSLAAIGLQPDYDDLLSILDVKPWGTPHRNIQQLNHLIRDLLITYRQGALIDIFEAINDGMPVILFVWTEDLPYWVWETWHAVVLVGYDDQDFFINDPAFPTAPQIARHGDLELAWIANDAYYAVIRLGDRVIS